MSDQDVIKLFNESYSQSYASWNTFFPEASDDLSFFLGDQWDTTEKRALFEQGRNAYVFNRIKRNINLVTGYQRKNRLSSVVTPIEGSDQKTADQLSKLLLYVYQNSNGYNTISDCFAGACKTGWNLASVYLDYVDDPKDGTICFSREPYSGFIVDPSFTNLDFSDCGFIIKRKYITPEQASSLLPGMEKDIMSLSVKEGSKDDKFTWLPYQQNPNGQNLVAYNEFYQQKWKKISLLVDMETGEYTEWDGDKARLEVLKSAYPNIEVVKKSKKYIERHIIVNDQLMQTDVNPYGLDEYPFVPFVAIFEPESDDYALRIQSLVRCQKDPQKEANRRRSQMSDILDSQVNSGWIAEEDSVINPQSLFQTSQGKVIWKKPELNPGALEKIPPAQIPPSMFQLQELYDRDMVEILGVNDASFGIVENAQESGIMMMLRQGASILNLQDVFDNLRLSQKMLSKKVLKLIQTWTPQKIERILNEKPSEAFYNKEFSKYDVAVGEGLLTDSQKMLYFRQLLDLKAVTDQPSASPITAQILIEAAPIQGKSDLSEKIAQNEQATQEAAQQQQAQQQQLIDAQRQMAQAKAISDIALSKERSSRAISNLSLDNERASKAVSDRAESALNRIKAIKEIQGMDDDKLMKYLGLIRLMEESSERQEDEIRQEDFAVAQISSDMNMNQTENAKQQQQMNEQMSMPQQGAMQ